MINVNSLSGGRTSTIALSIELHKAFGEENCVHVFCDTGCEDEDTYRFIRDAARELSINLKCIRLVMPIEHGVGATYEEISIDEIGQNLFAWKQMSAKYGNPYKPGGKFCTQQMKSIIFKKYCDDKFGKNGYYTWIGYRYEEGNRVWGDRASKLLGKIGLTNEEKTDLYLECKELGFDVAIDPHYPNLFAGWHDKEKEELRKAYSRIEKSNYRFLCELARIGKDFVKELASSFWFDLTIDEHLMNCLFCIEKPVAVVMLAIKDRPKEALVFLLALESKEVATKERKKDPLVMYRDGSTFRQLYEKAMSMSREEILEMSRLGKRMIKRNPCQSGECSAIVDIHSEQIEIKEIT